MILVSFLLTPFLKNLVVSEFNNFLVCSYGMQFILYLLTLSVGQRLCIDFSVLEVNFLTTLRSHLDITCSFYFWSNLLNVGANYNYIYCYLVNDSYFGSC